MAEPPSKLFNDSDYEAIAVAVEETVRGRWFLAEHAKRTRLADTRLVLDAIGRLQHALEARAPDLERTRLELVEMANVIARTRAEVAAIRPDAANGGTIGQAANELDGIVDTTERATSDILTAAELIQEIAWTLRERGADQVMCDQIDALTADTYTACSFQDITGQRIRKVIEALKFLERRIEAMIAIWRDGPGAASAEAGMPALETPAPILAAAAAAVATPIPSAETPVPAIETPKPIVKTMPPLDDAPTPVPLAPEPPAVAEADDDDSEMFAAIAETVAELAQAVEVRPLAAADLASLTPSERLALFS